MRPMAEAPGTVAIPIRGGRIEAFRPAVDLERGVERPQGLDHDLVVEL